MENFKLKLDINHILGYIFLFFLVCIILRVIEINYREYTEEKKSLKEANEIYETISSYCNREKKGVEKSYYCKNGTMPKEYINKIVDLDNNSSMFIRIYDFEIVKMSYNVNGLYYELINGKMEKAE